MRYLILLLSLLLYSKIMAGDTLKIEKTKTIAVKTNLAVLLMRGFSIQTEFVLNKKTGFWAEATYHCEDHSMYNVALKEAGILAGLNCYNLFRSYEGTKTHNGMYVGPYIKFKHGYYYIKEEPDYSALFLGIQAGMQTLLKENFIFGMGMGCGAGYFTRKQELPFVSLFDRYDLPVMDFRANICIGYLF
ncbi:MAG: hypothetical protein ACXVPN_03010 [Bacteroidia bacterium]